MKPKKTNMQLTKKEVVELIIKSLVKADKKKWSEVKMTGRDGFGNDLYRYTKLANAVIQALEDNRILCLVEENEEPKPSDLIASGDEEELRLYHYRLGYVKPTEYYIIQRNQTPVYICKQETK